LNKKVVREISWKTQLEKKKCHGLQCAPGGEKKIFAYLESKTTITDPLKITGQFEKKSQENVKEFENWIFVPYLY